LILDVKDFPPHASSRLELPSRGLCVVYGENGAGKSSLLEAYAAAHWGRSLRGASPWRDERCSIYIAHEGPALTVLRSSTSLTISLDGGNYAALTPTKTQQKLSSVVGDFATWRKTRVFDADLTARFGAEGDAERKRTIEQLAGLDKLDDGLRRCRADLRAEEARSTTLSQELVVLSAQATEQRAVTVAPSAAEIAELREASKRLERVVFDRLEWRL
jgi:DNA repair exonuclease SbcCD ATPase subunit